jgi:hypothetical protein
MTDIPEWKRDQWVEAVSQADEQGKLVRHPVTRRRFLHGAALAGATMVVPDAAIPGGARSSSAVAAAASAQAVDPRRRQASGRAANPIVPNFKGQYGAPVPDFQAPRRPMGNTGLQVSILGLGAITWAPSPDRMK